ncbi:uncharacterized protein LOC106476036, partial [Limulus polyphemus]|uniref:Uncharacterized protein LOC106476036 n=1 Tax=Limulus polyphemus TaxID=6850 RepID=A0ABM1C0L6_LIMPO
AKRAAYDLPDGAQIIVGPIKTTFSCDGYRYGYYADVDNDCKIFHICHPQILANGEQIVSHWSFYCGNQTYFDQLTLTCGHYESIVPCPDAGSFYYVNDKIGIEDALFLTDDDVQRANEVIGFGSRVQKK